VIQVSRSWRRRSLGRTAQRRNLPDGSKRRMQTPLSRVLPTFMLNEAIGIYSGGLSTVAGYQPKAANNLGVSMFGVRLSWPARLFPARDCYPRDGHIWHTHTAEISICTGFGGMLLMGKSVTSWFESRYHSGFIQRRKLCPVAHTAEM